MAESEQNSSLENRPGVLVIGAPNVGKRTLLSRLLSVDIPETSDLSKGLHCQGWTIDTKYYSVDISVWAAHLEEGFSFGSLPITKQLEALVMVFDMIDESSFSLLQSFVSSADIKNFEVLLCIGNKTDLVTGHNAHAEYRTYLQRREKSNSDPHPEFLDHGINEADGYSLLGEEEPSFESKKILDWCSLYNIEFIEACASNADFDKCLSIDGDIQGVNRVYDALSAHMWPGMILKSGNKVAAPTLLEKDETTDTESDYEFEYEILSGGSLGDWEGAGESSADFDSEMAAGMSMGATAKYLQESLNLRQENHPKHGARSLASASVSDKFDIPASKTIVDHESTGRGDSADGSHNLDKDEPLDFDDLERLMGEISNMRSSLRLMPDFQRREMAGKLALKMAAIFGDMSDEEEVVTD